MEIAPPQQSAREWYSASVTPALTAALRTACLVPIANLG